MYTANIKQVVVENFQVVAIVNFTNGANTIEKRLVFGVNVTPAEIKREVKRSIESLNQAEINAAKVVTGDVDLTGIDISTPSPTAEETARSTWFRDLRRLEAAQKLITLGVLTGNEQAVTNLRTKVKDNFLIGYVDFM